MNQPVTFQVNGTFMPDASLDSGEADRQTARRGSAVARFWADPPPSRYNGRYCNDNSRALGSEGHDNRTLRRGGRRRRILRAVRVAPAPGAGAAHGGAGEGGE